MNRADAAILHCLLDAVRAPEARQGELGDVIALARSEPDATLRCLTRHELGGVWRTGLRRAGRWDEVAPAVRSRLDEESRLRAGVQLLRHHVARRVGSALDEAGIPSVFFKGLHLQTVLYDPPWDRQMADVDVLVPLSMRTAALQALADSGFGGSPIGATISHEVALRGHGGELDVHWSLLRPGRAREELSAEVLSSRQRQGALWVPAPAHAMWLLLVHPAVTEHVTHRVGRAIDLDRWVRSQPTPWGEVERLLARTGLRTAAWAMATWTEEWLGTPFPEAFTEAIAPGSSRQAYLRAWLRADPAARFRHHPNLVRGGFGLAVQDRPGDAVKALAGILRARRRSARDCALVAQALSPVGHTA